MTNQTPESVIAEAMVNAGAPLMHSRVEDGVAAALRAANMLREPGAATDAREHLHAKCDCVPDLGPAHCHLCGNERGAPVPWPECSAVTPAVTNAIGRVRAIHAKEPVNGYNGTVSHICLSCERPWPCSTIEALDERDRFKGVEYIPDFSYDAWVLDEAVEILDEDGNLIPSGKHLRIFHQGRYVCDTCTNLLGQNVSWDRASFMEGHPLP